MTEENSKKNTKSKKGLSRRDFIKKGAYTGVAIAGTSAVLGGTSFIDPKEAQALAVKEQDEFPFDVPTDLKRYTAQRNPISRSLPPLGFLPENADLAQYGMNFGMNRWKGYDGERSDKAGFGVLDGAAAKAAFASDYYLNGNNSAGIGNVGHFKWNPPVNDMDFSWGDPIKNIHSPGVKNPEEATKAVKKLAKEFGGFKAGIAPYDEQWTYIDTHDGSVMDYVPVDFGFKPTHTIVVLVEMSYEGIRCAPSPLGSFEVGMVAQKMGHIAFSLSMFIKDLGYNAIPLGCDTSLSIPEAIQAGLGEYSRMGLLVTPEIGPRVRICKVVTDMPLNNDKPITFGVKEFCESCMKCAEACPSAAISFDAPTTSGPNEISSYSGIERWYIDGEKCISIWGSDSIRSCCAACIASCPYTKPETWHHTLIRSLTGLPVITPFMKDMDDIFGYGKTYDEQACEEWWKK